MVLERSPMMAMQIKRLNDQDITELENALTVARVACARVKSKFAYGSDIYDAADDTIKACNIMEDEAYRLLEKSAPMQKKLK
jgi:hypothetical protein